MAVIASDNFERTVAAGWGTADAGGAWSGDGAFANTANSSVDERGGVLLLARGGGIVQLPATSSTDTLTEVTYAITGGPEVGTRYIGLLSRIVGGNDYEVAVRHSLDGGVRLYLWKNRSAVTVVTTPNVYASWASGSTYHLKAEVTGTAPTTIRGKVWLDGDTEPDWQLAHSETPTGTHAGPGAVGIEGYRNSDGTTAPASLRFDNYQVTDLATPEPVMYVGAAPIVAAYLGSVPVATKV